MKKTVCELFAGVGGFRLGLERASKDFNTVWANQWEPGKKVQHAFDCYCKNFGISDNHVNEDIACVDKSNIPSHNLLVGGFPCQDYSVARTLSGSNGIEGKKGVLWWEIHNTIKEKKPPFVLLENVDRLLKSPATQRGRDFGMMLACFHEQGYYVEWRVINGADYGAAQRRRRTFIFAFHKDTLFGKTISKLDDHDILNQKGFFATTFPIEPVETLKKEPFICEDILEFSNNFSFLFCNSGFLKDGQIVTAEAIPVYEKPILLKDILEKNVAEKYYLGNALEKWEYLKGAKRIQRVSKTGHAYVFSEGPVAFPDSLDKPARTMLTSESSVNRSTHVITDPETNRLRILTPIEAERIQGFDDNWTKTDTMPERFRYFCMGNALVVPLVERMGKTLNRIFEEEA